MNKWRFEYAVQLLSRGQLKLFLKISYLFLRRRIGLQNETKRHNRKIRNPEIVSIRRQFSLNPIFSVVIPHFNYSNYIEKLLNSLRNQTLKSFEVLVVESGSDLVENENLKRVLSEFGDLDIRFFDRGEKCPPGSNRNFGIRQSNAELIVCIDPDDYIDSNFLEFTLFNLLYRDLDLVAVNSGWDGSEQLIYEKDIWEVPNLLNFRHFKNSNPLPIFTVIRREVWEAAGEFRDVIELDKRIHEDWLYWHRVAKLGFRIGGSDAQLATVRKHDRNLSRSTSVISNFDQVKINHRENAEISYSKSKLKSQMSNRNVSGDDILDLAFEIGADAPPSIFIFVPFVPLAGATKVIAKVVNKWHQEGIPVYVVCTEPEPIDLLPGESLFDSGIPIYRLDNLIGTQNFREYLDFFLYSRSCASIWNVGSSWVYENVEDLSSKFRIIDTQYVEDSIHYKNCLKNLQHIDLVVGENKALMKRLVDKALHYDTQFAVIRNGIDRSSLTNPYKHDNEKIFIFLGRFAPEKNPHAFVRLAAKIAPLFPNVKWLMIGDGPIGADVRKYAQELNANISFTGYITDPTPYLSRGSLLILPSTNLEGRPNVILEALSLGLPIIGFNVGGVSELVEHGKNGFLADPYDEQSLLMYCLKLLENENLFEEFSDFSFEIALNNDWETPLGSYREIGRWALQKTRAVFQEST